MAGHQHALARGQQMGDEVGDGVGLSSAWRTLDEYTLPRLEPLDDLALFVIGGQWEVDVRGKGFNAALVWTIRINVFRIIDDIDEPLHPKRHIHAVSKQTDDVLE